MKSKKITTYHNNGSVSYEAWHVNGRRHRADGPAEIWYNDDGSVMYEEWWIDGRKLTRDEFVAWRRKRIIDAMIKE